MSWVKIDDKAWSHPKIAALSGNAVKLWVFALCWCNAHQTDGNIPTIALRILGGSAKDARELVDANLWSKTDTGWMVHDYLDHQASAEQIRANKEAKANAGAKGGRRSGEARRAAGASDSAKQKRSKPQACASNESKQVLQIPRSKNEANPKQYKEEEEEEEEASKLAVAGARDAPDPAGGLVERVQEFPRAPGDAPSPRKDAVFERIPIARWWASQQILDWSRELKITDREFDEALVEARNKLDGLHDIEWWDIKILKFIEQKAKQPTILTAVVSP